MACRLLILVTGWGAVRDFRNRRRPTPPCPICHGTKRVPNEHNHFVVCVACDEEGKVTP